MKKLKFLGWAILAGAMALSFNSCGDDDDDEILDNGQEQNGQNGQNGQKEEAKGGNIVGTWVLDVNASSSDINAPGLEELMQSDPEMVSEYAGAATDIIGNTIIFSEGGRVEMWYEDEDSLSGTYKTIGSDLELTLPDEDGVMHTLKTGVDIVKEFSEGEESEALSEYMSMKVTSMQYTSEGNKLIINIIANGSFDLKAMMSAMSGEGFEMEFDNSEMNLPDVIEYTYNTKLVYNKK